MNFPVFWAFLAHCVLVSLTKSCSDNFIDQQTLIFYEIQLLGHPLSQNVPFNYYLTLTPTS